MMSYNSAVIRAEIELPEPAPKLILIGVSNPYRNAFKNWAAQQQVSVVSRDEPIDLGGTIDPALCIYESAVREDLINSIPALRKSIRAAPLVILTPAISMAATVQLMETGVQDVIEIPDSASDVVERAATRAIRLDLGSRGHLLVGRGSAMRRVRGELAAVAPTESVVLLTGETGTGKGLAARIIHDLSRRKEHAFVQVDCYSNCLAAIVVDPPLRRAGPFLLVRLSIEYRCCGDRLF